MSKAGERILRGAREALALTRNEADVNKYGVHIPDRIDVKSIRRRMGMSQAAFGARFGIKVATLRNWEQGRRQPDLTARALLTVIDREPAAVHRALTR